METPPSVSVLVAARNDASGVAELLDALAGQTVPAESFEVVVVDDASTDATAEVAAAGGRARVVRRDRRGGSYAARNSGLAVLRGRVVVTTDADCRPAPDWLERGLEQLNATGADLLGGRVEIPLGERPGLAETLDARRFLNQERAVRELGFAATANLFTRRAVFEAVGPFDERLISGGDAEFCHRAAAAGFRLVYSPLAAVTHRPRTRPSDIAHKAFRIGFGTGQMRRLGCGPPRGSRPAWASPRAYRPRRWFTAAEAGSAPRRMALEVAQYLLVQLPTIAGQAAADIRDARAH